MDPHDEPALPPCAACLHTAEDHDDAVWPPVPGPWGLLDDTPCDRCGCTWYEGPEPARERSTR
jgi:hypothetical protein